MSKYVIHSGFPQVNYHTEGDVEHVSVGNFTFTSITDHSTILVVRDMIPQPSITVQAQTHAVVGHNAVTNVINNAATAVHRNVIPAVATMGAAAQAIPVALTHTGNSCVITN